MTDQDRKFKEEWEKKRILGRWIYGLKHGSVFGFIVFLLINLYRLKDTSFSDVFFTAKALEQLSTMLLAGIVGYSTVKWWMNENIYKKIIDKG